MNEDIKRKVNLLGESAVGKTSLILRFVKDVFGEEYLKTVGTNVYTKKVPVTGSEVKLVIYDIMGDSGFDSVRNMAFEKSTGAIAVADCTREETLYKLIDDWLPKYRKLAADNAPVTLAVNKVDLEDQELTREEVGDNASQYFDNIFFTSAKTGENVEDVFKELGFRTRYLQCSPETHEENIVAMHRTIDEPKKLMSDLLAYGSQFGDMPFLTLDKLLHQSGIDKFSLDEEITEKKTLEFGDRMIEWYEENDYSKFAFTVKKLIEKYKKDS
ncbi:MAG: GTP-binding protein [Candidatus Thermoplasmatota archaeon]|nr:GTP-binding protein [Candidatus Thermoplasmatota archaeon]MBS3790674.1 GTP-binding protein [Candidatus Thermoplasmatota archaeon]